MSKPQNLSLRGWGLICGLALVTPLIGFTQDDPKGKPDSKSDTPAAAAPAGKPDRAALEKEFETAMNGCVLIGKFTVVGKENDPPKEERYTISRVKKQDDGEWIFVYQYGQKETQIPIKLQIEWAGDTPVITMTDFTIPGVGTFTARVLFYRGWYAGTWLHGKVGGHLFGRIEKLPAKDKGEKKSDKN